MTGFFIVIGLFLVIAVAMGIRYDRRQRRLGHQSGSATFGRIRLDSHTQADEWGGPG